MIKQEHLDYLDELRESGITNMYGARSYLIKEFNSELSAKLSNDDAGEVLAYWMKNFDNNGTKLKEDTTNA